MISPINPTKDETSIEVWNCYYLNTCGGNTNYGISKTSAEMQTEDFLAQLDGLHIFVMDNGTNNGYPIHSLANIKMLNASDITYNSATVAANIHVGNEQLVRAVLAYAELEQIHSSEQIEIEVDIDDYVEVTLENLNSETNYAYYLYCETADGFIVEAPYQTFQTTFDGITEISNSKISIYPNPTSDFIFIENIEPQQITIYSLDGKLVKTVENANIVDVRDLNDGLYLINRANTVLKFVIQR